MSNPNNCQHCGHKHHPDDGWCYMFRMEPTAPCTQHTLPTEAAKAVRMTLAHAIVNARVFAARKGAKT